MPTQRDSRSDLSPRKVAESLKQEGKQRLERGKTSAADQVDHVASALKRAGSELGDQSSLGNYAQHLADGISRFGSRLREGSIEELTSDIQAAARRNPALFIAGGFALGVVLARLLRASAQEAEDYEYDYDEQRTTDYAADSEAGAGSTGDLAGSRGSGLEDE